MIQLFIMPCPHYEGNNKCAFHDSSYVLEVSHVLSYCTSVGSKHQSCREFRRVHGLESTAETEDDPSQSSPKCTQPSGFLRRDQIVPLRDADVDSCYHEGPDGTFIPK